MSKIYYLKTCDTCRRILKELQPDTNTALREIGSLPISPEELDEMYQRSGSYESLINKRAKLFTAKNLMHQSLSEADYKGLLLEHYTFLKRPVVVTDTEIYIGNAPKTVALAKKALHP